MQVNALVAFYLCCCYNCEVGYCPGECSHAWCMPSDGLDMFDYCEDCIKEVFELEGKFNEQVHD